MNAVAARLETQTGAQPQAQADTSELNRDNDYTIRSVLGMKHPVSGLSHLIGAALGTIWTVGLVEDSLARGSRLHLAVSLIFGVSMVLLYLASSAYHLIHASERGTKLLRTLDHSMIFVFITGTYTPIYVLSYPQPLGWRLALVMWAIAISGVLIRLFRHNSPRWIRTSLYVGMGWMSAFYFSELADALGPQGFALFLWGGAAYSVGSLVYALKRPNPIPEHFGFHEIWHLFVLAGSTCHFWAIKYHILNR